MRSVSRNLGVVSKLWEQIHVSVHGGFWIRGQVPQKRSCQFTSGILSTKMLITMQLVLNLKLISKLKGWTMTGSFGHTTFRTLTTFLSLLTGNIWICAHESNQLGDLWNILAPGDFMIWKIQRWCFVETSWYDNQPCTMYNFCMHPVRCVGVGDSSRNENTHPWLWPIIPPRLELDSCWR